MASKTFEGSSCANAHVTAAHVLGFEVQKSFFNVMYTYIIEVSWSYGHTHKIRRKYIDFFDMQCCLLDKFPEQNHAHTRTLPYLPGRKILTFNTMKVAQTRVVDLNEYVEKLIKQENKISQSEYVLQFFERQPLDEALPVYAFSRNLTNDVDEELSCSIEMKGSQCDLLQDT